MKIVIFVIVFSFFSGQAASVDYRVEEIEFTSHRTRLSGAIVFPKTREAHSAVVFVHGSGKQSRNMHWAERFASEGIVALVYDKRGAGRSGGDYEGKQSVSEKNINLLVDDSIAALNVLSRHPQTEGLALGLSGISQAGWIVPLAAEKSKIVDFMVLWSAPVCKVSEEDIYSKYTSDLDGRQDLELGREQVPSYEVALKSRKVKYIWPDFLGKDTDSGESLAKLKIPGLWVFGGLDGSIPVDLSIRRLKVLSNSGRDYDYVFFSNLGHNNMSETFPVAIDWINKLSR